MKLPLEQHQTEIQQNLQSWEAKPLLQKIYAGFYDRIVALIDERVPGRIVEIGSGIGNLKSRLPRALATDLFPNPWLDLVCDGYELPFRDGSVSHLVLFDVFHHLEAPNAFLKEARRALAPSGRLILFEPFISVCSFPVYGLLHHEPVAMGKTINRTQDFPRPRAYYAAQGNATRLFFRKEVSGWPAGWNVFHAEAFGCFHYLLSGGFSKPAMYPTGWLDAVRHWDAKLSRWPRLFGGRCLVGMCPAKILILPTDEKYQRMFEPHSLSVGTFHPLAKIAATSSEAALDAPCVSNHPACMFPKVNDNSASLFQK